MKPFIYLASPYTKGDPCINTNFQMRMFARFVKDGVVDAYIPLWSHFQHSAFPEPYTTWINYDLAIIPRLDGVIRLNADIPELNYFEDKSSGADGEVRFAQERGLPTWTSLVEMYDWAKGIAISKLEQATAMVRQNFGGPEEDAAWKAIEEINAYLQVANAAIDRAVEEADKKMCISL